MGTEAGAIDDCATLDVAGTAELSTTDTAEACDATTMVEVAGTGAGARAADDGSTLEVTGAIVATSDVLVPATKGAGTGTSDDATASDDTCEEDTTNEAEDAEVMTMELDEDTAAEDGVSGAIAGTTLTDSLDADEKVADAVLAASLATDTDATLISTTGAADVSFDHTACATARGATDADSDCRVLAFSATYISNVLRTSGCSSSISTPVYDVSCGRGNATTSAEPSRLSKSAARMLGCVRL